MKGEVHTGRLLQTLLQLLRREREKKSECERESKSVQERERERESGRETL